MSRFSARFGEGDFDDDVSWIGSEGDGDGVEGTRFWHHDADLTSFDGGPFRYVEDHIRKLHWKLQGSALCAGGRGTENDSHIPTPRSSTSFKSAGAAFGRICPVAERKIATSSSAMGLVDSRRNGNGKETLENGKVYTVVIPKTSYKRPLRRRTGSCYAPERPAPDIKKFWHGSQSQRTATTAAETAASPTSVASTLSASTIDTAAAMAGDKGQCCPFEEHGDSRPDAVRTLPRNLASACLVDSIDRIECHSSMISSRLAPHPPSGCCDWGYFVDTIPESFLGLCRDGTPTSAGDTPEGNNRERQKRQSTAYRSFLKREIRCSNK